VHYEDRVYIKAREPIAPKSDSRSTAGLADESSDDDDEPLSPVVEVDDEVDDRSVKNVLGKPKKKETKPPPLLLYKATNLVLMNAGLATRVWNAVDKMAPGLVRYAEQKRIKTRYYTDANERFAPRRIDCCGVLNDILLTMQEHSLQHPPDSVKGKMFGYTLDLIRGPGIVGSMIPLEAIRFGHSLDKITYKFGRND
jgi:hypothetical protein